MEENPRKDFFRNERRSGGLRAKAGGPRGPISPHLAARGEAATHRFVGPLDALCPRFCAYISPKIPQKIRRSSKVLFRRHKLLSPQDPFWGTFCCLTGGGFGYGGLLHQHHDLSDDA